MDKASKKPKSTEMSKKTQKGKSQKDKTTKKAIETNFVKIARNAKRAGKPKNTKKA